MIELPKIRDLIKKRIENTGKEYPKHIITNLDCGISEESLKILDDIINEGLRLDIPINTVAFSKDDVKEDTLIDYIEKKFLKICHENKIRVLVIGKWYGLRGDVVSVLKRISLETKDYDKFFVNICINYDGQQEIVDACWLLLKDMKDGKINEKLSKDLLKGNLYSSYFVSPELVIETGKKLTGTFLWDMKGSYIFFFEKGSAEFNKQSFLKGIEYYQKR